MFTNKSNKELLFWSSVFIMSLTKEVKKRLILIKYFNYEIKKIETN